MGRKLAGNGSPIQMGAVGRFHKSEHFLRESQGKN